GAGNVLLPLDKPAGILITVIKFNSFSGMAVSLTRPICPAETALNTSWVTQAKLTSVEPVETPSRVIVAITGPPGPIEPGVRPSSLTAGPTAGPWAGPG